MQGRLWTLQSIEFKKEVSKIIPKARRFVNRSNWSDDSGEDHQRKPTISHAVAENLSELELEKDLKLTKMEVITSIYRSDIQSSLQALVEAYKADIILFDTLWAWILRTGKEPAVTVLQVKRQRRQQERYQYRIKTHKKSASHLLQWSKMIQAGEEVQHLLIGFQQPQGLPYPDHAWICLLLSVVKPKVLYFSNEDYGADYGHIKWIEDLGLTLCGVNTLVKYDKFALGGISIGEKKAKTVLALQLQRNQLVDVFQKDGSLMSLRKSEKYRVEERIAFKVSLECLPRRVVIQRRWKIFNWCEKLSEETQPHKAWTPYKSNLRDKTHILILRSKRIFIYENKYRRTIECALTNYTSSTNGTIDDVRIALKMIAQGNRMEYLPKDFLEPT
ncbi:hypothetical protein Tco_1214678 [Tanacetum coccineum]